MKERRARCFALCGGSKACPDLFEGSFLDLLSIFYYFLKVFVVSAQGRFGIGAFCFKTKDTSHSRGDEREKQIPIHKTKFLHSVQDDTCIAI